MNKNCHCSTRTWKQYLGPMLCNEFRRDMMLQLLLQRQRQLSDQLRIAVSLLERFVVGVLERNFCWDCWSFGRGF